MISSFSKGRAGRQAEKNKQFTRLVASRNVLGVWGSETNKQKAEAKKGVLIFCGVLLFTFLLGWKSTMKNQRAVGVEEDKEPVRFCGSPSLYFQESWDGLLMIATLICSIQINYIELWSYRWFGPQLSAALASKTDAKGPVVLNLWSTKGSPPLLTWATLKTHFMAQPFFTRLLNTSARYCTV